MQLRHQRMIKHKWNEKKRISWYHDKIIQLQDIVKLCYEHDSFLLNKVYYQSCYT